MSEENEDQWLYGDSIDEKVSFPPEESFQNDKENAETTNQELLPNINENSEAENSTTFEVASEAIKREPELDKELEQESNEINETNENNENIESNEANENSDKNVNNEADAEEKPEKTENGSMDVSGNQDENDMPSDSDSDDDVHVVIGDIKSTPTYNSLNIKRGGPLLNASGIPDKLNKQSGKFSMDEFETIGVINGIPAHEYNLDQLEDKPWRQPGADITDYFNYGFNEETWRAYCERQKRMRSESGVGLILNAGGPGGGPIGPGLGGGIGGLNSNNINSTRIPQVAITNDNSKYSGIMGPKRAGPPPGRKMAGTIDVIGSSGLASRRNIDKSPPKENVIQVMTADRREYSRKPGFPDMSVPPPNPTIPPQFDIPPPGYQEPSSFYMNEPDPYYQSYEPTQDSQWGNDPTWQPTNLAIPLTESSEKDAGPKSIPTMVPPLSIPPLIPPPSTTPNAATTPPSSSSSSSVLPNAMMRDSKDLRDRSEREIESMGRDRDRDRDRDRERDRDRDRDRDRMEREKDSMVRDRDRESVSRDDDKERDRSRSQYRHKERHRHRSRSRSRRHKSRSRSPSRRKKKSRRSDRERSKDSE